MLRCTRSVSWMAFGYPLFLEKKKKRESIMYTSVKKKDSSWAKLTVWKLFSLKLLFTCYCVLSLCAITRMVIFASGNFNLKIPSISPFGVGLILFSLQFPFLGSLQFSNWNYPMCVECFSYSIKPRRARNKTFEASSSPSILTVPCRT